VSGSGGQRGGRSFEQADLGARRDRAL